MARIASVCECEQRIVSSSRRVVAAVVLVHDGSVGWCGLARTHTHTHATTPPLTGHSEDRCHSQRLLAGIGRQDVLHKSPVCVCMCSTCVCMLACRHACMYERMYEHAWVCICACMRVLACVCAWMHLRMLAHTCMCARAVRMACMARRVTSHSVMAQHDATRN